MRLRPWNGCICTPSVEHLGKNQRLARSLLEPTQADHPVDDDLAGVDCGDATDRDEDAASRLHLGVPTLQDICLDEHSTVFESPLKDCGHLRIRNQLAR